MATPPTLVSYGASTFSSQAAPLTVSVTVQTNDILVVLAVCERAASPSTGAPSGGSLTYTQQASVGADSNHSRAIAWTATATSNATFSVSCPHPDTGNGVWGVMVWVWRGSGGVGAIGAPAAGVSNTVTLTTTGANSGLAVGSADWNAVDGTTRTRLTINSSTGAEDTYFRNSANYTVYASHYLDTGAAGSVTGGYSAPTGQSSAIIAVEVLGAATAASPKPPLLVGAYNLATTGRRNTYW